MKIFSQIRRRGSGEGTETEHQEVVLDVGSPPPLNRERALYLLVIGGVMAPAVLGLVALPFKVWRGYSGPPALGVLCLLGLLWWVHRRFRRLPPLTWVGLAGVLLWGLVYFLGSGVARSAKIDAESEVVAACKENLEVLAGALERFRAEHGGQYPENLGLLIPRYLEELPTCPPPRLNVDLLPEETRSYAYQTTGTAYTVACVGDDHGGRTLPGFPQYRSGVGVVDR